MSRIEKALRYRASRAARLLRRPTPEQRREDLWEQLATECDSVSMTRGGLRWTAPVGDRVGHDLFVTGSYQSHEIQSVQRWLVSAGRNQPLVVEVGANIGSTTIPFVQLGRKVLAIEPVPAALGYLRANVTANGLDDKVRVIGAAVAREPGTVEMALDGDLGHSEIVRPGAVPGFGDGVRETVAVEAVPLNDLLRRHQVDPGDVAVVWSDTQGHEAEVLASGTDLWSHGVPCFIEVWPRGLRSHGALDDFDAAARASFTSFVGRDDLMTPGRVPTPAPIAQLRSVIDAVDALEPGQYGRFTDVLLIP